MPPKVRNRLNFLINIVYYATIVTLVYLGFKYVFGWLLPFILAFCIVSIVNPIIRFMHKKLKIKHAAASIIVMLLTYTLVGTILFQIIMRIVFFLRDVFSALPEYYQNTISPMLDKTGSDINALAGQIPDLWGANIADLNIDVGGAIQNSLTSISQMGINLVSVITGQIPAFVIAFVFTIMLSFFISVQYDKVTLFIKSQLPEKAGAVLTQLKSVINDIVLKYLKAVIKLMFITFAELSVGLLVLRTDYAVPVAAGIAIFDALPFFGTGTIMIPWIIFELIQANFTYALGLGILYAIITVVRNIIEPHVVGQKLGLNPIVSIVSIYLGFKLIGVAGMIIMPMVVQVLIEMHKIGAIKIFSYKKAGTDNEQPDKDPGDAGSGED